ncbi:MAG: radical SAM protein [Gammaproteobacteria bacterium]|jgi:MoaA/NifB/PqqE/SkfB family radical SAM enzyme
MKLYLRKEFFGSIIYNPSNAKYFNLDFNQTNSLINFFNNENQISEQTIKGETLFTLIVGNKLNQKSLYSLKYIHNNQHIQCQNKLSVPLKVFFNITKKCNLFCKHCYNDSGHVYSPELPLIDIIKTLKELEVRGIFKITIAGGEPLFHRNFDEIIDYLSNTDLAVSLITNGICISENRAKFLSKNLNVRSITISLDGASSKDNDIVRGEKTFNRIIRGIKNLKKYYDRSLAVRITIMRSNIDTIKDFPSLVAKFGVNEIKVNSINAYGRAKCAPELFITTEEYNIACKQLLDSSVGHNISIEVPAYKYRRDHNGEIGLCKSGEETFEIDSDGSVFPCSFSFGNFLSGNICHDTFDDILYNLQLHNINNTQCYQCKGRGGVKEKIFGTVPLLVHCP